MASRQERRKAERDAAKRAPTAAGSAGAAAATAAPANVNARVDQLGDWTTQSGDPGVLMRALGAEGVKQRADRGDPVAQWSYGFWLMSEGDPNATQGMHLGDARRSPVGDEGMALVEKAAGQGHVHAMDMLGQIHTVRKQHERAAEWYAKGAEAGLPNTMYNLAVCLDTGAGVAQDFPTAAAWYRRAADGGSADAANNLAHMYLVGRGVTRSKRRAMKWTRTVGRCRLTPG